MNRQDLEQQAMQAVCPCWYYDLSNDIDQASDDDLKKIIDYPAWNHLQNQKHNPVTGKEFMEELAECPETELVA